MPTARTKVLTWEVSGSLYSEDSKERNMLWGRPRLCSQTAGLDISLSSLTSTTLGSSLYACVSLPEKILRKPTSCMLSHFSHVRLIVTLWIVAHQAAVSMEFSRQEYWSGLPCPSPWDLPDPGIEPTSLMSPVLEDGFFTTSTTWEAHMIVFS